MVRTVATLLWVITVAWSLSLSAAPAVSEWSYTARPGDNLWELARRFCGSHHHALELARHNRLADPSELVAGERLSIPVSCLVKQPAAASVVAAGTGAKILRDGVEQSLAINAEVLMGDEIRTTSNFVVVRFADGSMLTIRPQSSVMFVLISAFGETGMVDTLVRVGRGRVQHVVDQGVGGSRHRIATPVGIAAVRGTRYRVGVLGGDDGRGSVTTVATTEGEVQFQDAAEAKLALPAGTGAVASASGAVKENLLAAPRFTTAGVQNLDSSIAWLPVVGANGYRLTVFNGATPVLDIVTNDEQAALGLGLGRYQVEVRAIAASGLEGLSASGIVEFVTAPPTQLQHTNSGDGRVEMSWVGDVGPYTVQLRNLEGEQWRSYEAAASRTVLELAPGRYEWRVAAADERYGESAFFDVAPSPVDGLEVSRADRNAPLVVTWRQNPALPEDNKYTVEVSAHADFATFESTQVQKQSAEVAFKKCRPCYVRVRTESAGVVSAYNTAEFTDKPGHPWPLYVVLLAVLAAL